jgi:Tol biopolymer transport system component
LDAKETALVPAKGEELSGVLFSPDDSLLYYRRKGATDDGELYRVPVKGGTPQRVIGGVSGAAAISPDGRRVAFVRLKPSTWEESLVVADAQGGGEFTLLTVQRPRYVDQHSVAWSPDGRSIACFAGEAGTYSAAAFRLIEIRLDDRSQHAIGRQFWAWPRSVAWSAKGDVLIVTAASQDADVHQLWMVQHGNGGALRLTNDLSNYDRVTITGDGSSLATVQSEPSASLWVLSRGEPARISRAPLRSRRIAVAWTPDGRILYSDPAGDYRNLWLIDSDGANLRQVTSSPGSKDQIAVSRDGRYIVYKQAGNIWRVDADGSHARQLTHGALDVHPDVTADGRAVVYASFANWSPAVGGEPTLWKIPIDGGEPVEISKQPASYPRVSPDGTRLGFIHFPGKDPRFSPTHVGMLRFDGMGGFTVLDASPGDETDFSWSPDGKALDYIANAGGVGNIWRQPMEGGPAERVTNFGSDELYAFSWSRDGKLVCARGTTTRGVVLIENFR